MGSWQKKKLVQNLHKLLTTEKPINIIQDKNYQSDFDRLMAETAETERGPCFELFYRNTGRFVFGKP